MHKFSLQFKLLTLALLVNLCACTSIAYSPNISQGNIITQELVVKITNGMSKDKVIAILGTPILEATINPNIIEYVYFEQKKHTTNNYKRVTIVFENNKVSKINIVKLEETTINNAPKKTP